MYRCTIVKIHPPLNALAAKVVKNTIHDYVHGTTCIPV